MKKSPSVFLRSEIHRDDVQHLSKWMRKKQVTCYLHEKSNISDAMLFLLSRIRDDMLTCQFNQNGRFFMVCNHSDEPIGFVRAVYLSNEVCEIVYVIGEKQLWGHGYGCLAIDLLLRKIFYEMRKKQVVAKIHRDNLRSQRAALRCGMTLSTETGLFLIYRISVQEYMQKSAG